MAANPYQDWLDEYADEYGVDRSIVSFVADQESGRDANAVSPKGAVGVMQILPDTAAQPGGEPLVYEGEDLRNPQVNIRAGTDYLSRMLGRYDNKLDFALAAYNWGPGNTDQWIADGAKYSELPEETYNYIQSAKEKLSGTVSAPDNLSEVERKFGVRGAAYGIDTPFPSRLASQPVAGPAPPPPSVELDRGVFRTVGDLGLKAGSGTMGLMSAAADMATPDPRPDDVSFLDQMLSGIGAAVGDWAGFDSLSEYGHTEQVRIARSYMDENERRKAAGEPTLEQERKGQVGTRASGYFNEYAEVLNNAMSNYQKQQDRNLGLAANEGAGATFKFLWDNPLAVAALIAESGAMMGAAGGIAKATKVGAVAAGWGEGAVRGASIAASIGAETTIASGMNAMQAQLIIERLSNEALGSLPEAQKLLAQGMSLEDARGLLRQRAGDATWGFSVVSNLVTLGISQRLGANVVADVLAGTARKGVGTAGRHMLTRSGKELGQEFFQETGDAYAGSVGEIAGGARPAGELNRGVLGQGIMGAAAGGVVGASLSPFSYDRAAAQEEIDRPAQDAFVDELNNMPPPSSPPPGAGPAPEPEFDAAAAQRAEDEAWQRQYEAHTRAGASDAAARGAADMDKEAKRAAVRAANAASARDWAAQNSKPPDDLPPPGAPPANVPDDKVDGKLIKSYKSGDQLVLDDGSRVTLTEKTARQASAMARRINSGIGVLPEGIDMQQLAAAVGRNEQVELTPEQQKRIATGTGTTGSEQLDLDLVRKPQLIPKPVYASTEAKQLVPLTPTQAKDVEWALDAMLPYWTDDELSEQRMESADDQPYYFKEKALPRVMKMGNKYFLKPSPVEEINDDLHYRIVQQLPGIVDENVVEGLSPADKKKGDWLSPAQGRARQTNINKFGDKLDTRRVGLPSKPVPTTAAAPAETTELIDDTAPRQGTLLSPKTGRATAAAKRGATPATPAPAKTPTVKVKAEPNHLAHKTSATQLRELKTVVLPPNSPLLKTHAVKFTPRGIEFINDATARSVSARIRNDYSPTVGVQIPNARRRSMLGLADKIDAALVVEETPRAEGTEAAAQRKELRRTKGELKTDKTGLIHLLSQSMYKSDLVDVSVKELAQNSFDGVKAGLHNGLISTGDILIETDMDERRITVTDNGIGMTPGTVQDAFLTIAGTDKSDLPPHLRSGGLGMAKVMFLLANQSVRLKTTRDIGADVEVQAKLIAEAKKSGDKEAQEKAEIKLAEAKSLIAEIGANVVTTEVEATAIEIVNGDFDIATYEAQPGEIGTSVSVVVPEEVVDSAGTVTTISWPGNFAYGFKFLGKPLLAPDVKIRLVSDGDPKPLNMGQDFDLTKTPYLTSVEFDWGTADIYMGEEDIDWGADHQVLSSGIYQFDHSISFQLRQRIPRNIIIDVKPNVDTRAINYPFNNAREDFRSTVAGDVSAIEGYLGAYYRSIYARKLAETFQKPTALPKIDYETGTLTKIDRIRLEESTDRQIKASEGTTTSAHVKTAARLEPIKVSGTSVTNEAGNAVVEKDTTAEEQRGKVTFKPTEHFADAFDYKIEPDGDIDTHPQLQINVGPDTDYQSGPTGTLLEAGQVAGDPIQFFAELGSLMMDIRDALKPAFDDAVDGDGRIGTRYQRGGPSDYYVGVSVDKDYGGVNILVPFKGAFINPFYHEKAWHTTTPEGLAFNWFNVMLHELSHISVGDHDNKFVTVMIKAEAYLYDTGLREKFFAATLGILERHKATYAAMREYYDDQFVTNVGKSLEKFGDAAQRTKSGEQIASAQSDERAEPEPQGRDEVPRDAGIAGEAGGTSPVSEDGGTGGVVPPIYTPPPPPPTGGPIALPPADDKPGGPLFPYNSEPVDPDQAEAELDNGVRIDVRRTTSRPEQPTVAGRRTQADRDKADKEKRKRIREYLYSRTVGIGTVMDYLWGNDVRDRTGSKSLGVDRFGFGTPPPMPPDDPFNLRGDNRRRRPGSSRQLAKRAWGKYRTGIIELWQDNFISVYDLQQVLAEDSGIIPDNWQLHGAQTRAGVMVDWEFREVERLYVEPIMKAITTSTHGVGTPMEIGDADEWMAANHSPYRNYYVWNIREGRKSRTKTEKELRISPLSGTTQPAPSLQGVGNRDFDRFGSPSGVLTSEAHKIMQGLVNRFGDKHLAAVEDAVFALAEYQRMWLAPISINPDFGHDLLTTPQYDAWTPDPVFLEKYRNVRDRQGYMAAHEYSNYNDISLHDWMMNMHSVTYVPLKDASMTEEQRRLMERIQQTTKTFFVEASVFGDEEMAALGRDGKGLGSQPISHLLVRMQESLVRGIRNAEQSKRIVAIIQEIDDPRIGVVSDIVDASSLSTAGHKLTMMGNRRRPRFPTPRTVPSNQEPARVVHKMGDKEQVALIYHGDLAAALTKQIGSGGANNTAWKTYLNVSRVIRELQTTHNPGFVATNPFREIETALLQVGNIPGVTPQQEADMRAKLLEGGMRNMWDWTVEYGKEIKTPGVDLASLPHDQRVKRRFIRSMMKAGAHSSAYKPFDEVEMQRQLHRVAKRLAKAHKAGNIPAHVWEYSFKMYGKWMDLAAMATENSPRLIVGYEVYKLRRSEGIPHDQAINHAANVAHDQSVNFQRVGRLVQAARINKLYDYFNPAIQGTARWVKFFASKRGMKAMAALYGVGVMAALINRMLAGEDDDGNNYYETKAPKWKRQRNLIMVIPGTQGEHISIPLAYGMNFFVGLGDITVSATLGASDRQMTVGEALEETMPLSQRNLINDDPFMVPGEVLNLAMTSFLPLEGNALSASGVLSTITPSRFSPLVDINLTNRDWKGMPIQPEPYVGSPQLVPDSRNLRDAMAKDSLTAMSYWVAQSVNDATGGDEFNPGVIDWSPYSIAYQIKANTGGAGMVLFRALDSVHYMVKGDWGEAARQTPVLRRFYGLGESRYSVRNRYTKLRMLLEPLRNQRDVLTDRSGSHEDKDIDALQQFREQNPDLNSLLLRLKASENRLSVKNRQRSALKDVSERTEAQQRKLEKIDEDATDIMYRFNDYYFKEYVQ